MNENTLNCEKCPLRIITAAKLYTVCSGPCAKAFHVACAGLKKKQLESLSENVLWICDVCLSDFRDWKKTPDITNPDPATMALEISQLKTQVAVILESIASITPMPSSSSVVMHQSTPISRSSATNENNTNCNCVCANVIDTHQSVYMEERIGDEKNFSLLLSNIDKEVTEDEIRSMVCRCLGVPVVDRNNVRKLVPKWMNCSSVDYVSFKVDLSENLKHLAMQSSTWPSRIKYREFVNRQHHAWKPELQ